MAAGSPRKTVKRQVLQFRVHDDLYSELSSEAARLHLTISEVAAARLAGGGIAASGKRCPLNMRTTIDIRKKLDAAAGKSGRSLAQEVEFRLEQSFDREALLKIVTKAIINRS